MNKKAYITPEMEIMNIETVEMIATSNLEQYEVEATSHLGNNRRGTWGNLWNE